MRVSQEIDCRVAARSMLEHPFYQAWSHGTLPFDTLRAYSRQYFHHVEAFPTAVSAVHNACPDRQGRRMLAENLAEEEGLGAGKQDHASLWLMFAEGLGESEAEVREQELNGATRELIATFQRLTKKSYASGLGALYAYESQFPAIAKAKITGLVERYGIWDESTLSFFHVHQNADVEHAAICRDLLDVLPEQQQEAVAAGAEIAGALWNFLSGVHGSEIRH
jgi:pyrroloquinoline-quinone synthase